MEPTSCRRPSKGQPPASRHQEARQVAHYGNRVARGGASLEIRGPQLLELSPEREGRVVALLADLFEAALRSRSGGLTGPPWSRSPRSTTEEDL
jgi:hypothetical protein